ncbi:phytanoyl-CoA dioxygenase family protein [Catenulispora pinisilvae]|uniref:phytanoyl-CoA dioxygenase family protein n=1 Tax=Catenulispora pinisilvae TaxID=2705253 RepID=UPI001891F4BE|nr:phytanoyl-CoA dioxygenase family protein [Catenulispora pinisilvae]
MTSDASPSRLLEDTLTDAYHRDGFVRGQRLLEDAHADELHEIIREIVENPDHEYHRRVYDFKHAGRPLLHIKNMWKRYDAFAQLYRHPLLTEALHNLTGHTRFHLWQDRFFYKPANAGGIHTWHQDSTFLPFLPPFRTVSAWISLNGADEDNGAMWMVPGSHGWGDATDHMERLAEHVGAADQIPDVYQGHEVSRHLCPVPKGYVHFHDAFTWHCSGPNWSDRSRSAIGLFFVTADVRFDGENKWAKDYEGEHGQPLDTRFYPEVTYSGDAR